MSDALVRKLVDVALQVPRETLPSVLAWLRRSAVETASPMDVVVASSLRSKLDGLVSAWRKAPFAGGAVALALHSAAATAEHLRRSERVELVWTGPDPDAATWRRLDRALLQVVGAAEHRLLLTTFAAYPGAELLQAIEAAVARGVNVWIILETKADSGGKLDHDGVARFAAALGGSGRIFNWPAGNRPAGKPATLHAKIAVADDALALVSSANLTGAALEYNIEAGVLVHGGRLPRELREHIDRLVEMKMLLPLQLVAP
jgi:phosphatidylserine/phosphatidylglycerophosphate/cardiolipin synthase-like enzyme